MTKLPPDSLELLETLATHQVRALVVGGHAVAFHGYARTTEDLDIFFDRGRDNCERLYAALLDFWGGAFPSSRAQTTSRGRESWCSSDSGPTEWI